MFPFWEVAVAPVLEAAEAHRLVEVGALRGDNTRLMLERLGPTTELHVIDPLPDFDPSVHEREFAGQYVFHRDLSLNVLGDLPPMDAALIDGDHNWYTVYNELRLLREVARAHDAPLPVLLLHDVGWPYGRRDLYYDPDTIPAEHRKEWKRAGMEPDKVRLVPFGAGLNPTLANARAEGGRHNGVMTGLDDFVAEHDRPVRVVVLPTYFGLAIVVEHERLARQPALAAELDRLEGPEGKDQLLRLAEDIRLEALMFQHRIFYDREASVARLAHRYLDQVKAGPAGDGAPDGFLDHLEVCLDDVRAEHVRGGLAAVGVEPPASALFLGAYLDAHMMAGRQLWVPADQELDALRAGWTRLDLSDAWLRVIGSGDGGDQSDQSDQPDQLALVLLAGRPTGPDGPPSPIGQLLGRLSHGGRVVATADADPDLLALVAAHPDLVEVDAPSGGPGRTWRRAVGGAPAGDAPDRIVADGIA